MAQKLVVPITFQIYQNGALVRTETIAQDVIKIGRDQKSHLRVEDEGVARMHAVIEAKPDDVQIIDLGSGTQVNGQPVNKCSLRSGDTFQLGNTRITVEIGAAREASAVTAGPVAASGFVAPTATAMPSAPAALGASFGVSSTAAAVDGEEIYQLIKRGEINPHEVEEVGGHAVEVSVLWKSSILHVAHLDNSKNFVLTSHDPKHAPDSNVLMGSLAVGGALMLAGAAIANGVSADMTESVRNAIGNKSMVVGGIGAITTLVGSGVAGQLHHKNEDMIADTSRFVVGAELLGGAMDMPVVMNGGGTRFVFLPDATGEVELQGVKRSLEDLKSQGHARPSSAVPGGFEVNIAPEGRYRQEVGGLTIIAKVVAPGRIVAGHIKRDNPLMGAMAGSGLFVAAVMATLHFAVSDSSGFLSSANEDDRLAELRAFIQRQQERQPEQQQQQNDDQQEGGTGTRHAGAEGKMGRRDAPTRSARYAIKNNNEPPHLSRQQAREQVQNRGIFAALGALGGGASGGASGIVSPFGGMTESGVDNQNANGNMTGDAVGDAFGYGGLGATGTGWGGGGTGEGTIGMGNIGTMGHGSGTGSGQGYGAGAGRGLRGRGTSGPTVRAAPPEISGLLSPEAIRRVVLRNLGQVNHCHEQGLATNPNAAGRVTVRFVIGGSGSVMGSGVAGSTYPIQSVGDCIANAVRRWQFPAPEGGGVVTVNYPFNLQPPDQ
ncbi:MAG: AgmX/PglI C-terminal domain-containing protein [Polyangiales bacterium]